MPETLPILIVGAGPTGLTAAMELSRLGIPVRLVDKLTQFSTTSRALAVQARTLEFFQQRGLAEQMLQLGNQGRATSLYAGARLLGRVDLTRIHSRFNFILLLAQSETERILREQVARQGVTIETGTELIALGQAETGQAVTAILRKSDGATEQTQAAYVIAADGAHSVLRHTLQLGFPGKSLPHSYALADLHADTVLPDDELSIFFAEQGLLAIFPIGNRRFRLIATEGEVPKDAPDPDLTRMQQLYNASAHIPARLYDMVWSSHFRINSRMLERLRFGRIFFGGDAAQIHSPAGGQGMNTGIQDMINLCWKLAFVHKGLAPDALLDTYEPERLPVIQAIVSTTERATDLVTSASPAIHSMIAHIAPRVLHRAAVQNAGANLISETDANYRHSLLSGRAHGLGWLRAGDRLPDVPVLLATSTQPQQLLDLLDPSRFTLLLLTNHSPTQNEPSTAESKAAESTLPLTVLRIGPGQANAGNAHRFKLVFPSASWVLIRPDGYIALAGRGSAEPELSRWQEGWSRPPS